MKTQITLVLKAECHEVTFAQRAARREAKSGALAQLGERLICIQEVIGSIPIGSTMNGSVAQVVRAHA